MPGEPYCQFEVKKDESFTITGPAGERTTVTIRAVRGDSNRRVEVGCQYPPNWAVNRNPLTKR